MASFLAKRKEVANGENKGPSLSPGQRKRFPNLAALLEGVGVIGDPERIPSFGLVLFASEGGIRFSLSAKETGEAWFGNVGAAEDVLGSVEAALAAGEVEAKLEKRGKGNKPF
jgi:hypothetical protein